MKYAIVLCLILAGCGEHPEVKARRERIRQMNVKPRTEPTPDPISIEKTDAELLENAPVFDAEKARTEADLQAARDQIAAIKRELANAKKTGFTGAKLYCTADCIPCARLEAALKKAGWTVGDSAKFHFWKIITTDKENHPLVPHLVYWNDGRQMKGEIVGFDGSDKSLAEIIAKHPLSHKGKPEARNAAVETGSAHASVPPVFPPPVPPSEDIDASFGSASAVVARSDCGGGFSYSGCGAPSFGCGAPMGCGAPVSYAAPVYSYQPQFNAGIGVNVGRCWGGVCW